MGELWWLRDDDEAADMKVCGKLSDAVWRGCSVAEQESFTASMAREVGLAAPVAGAPA